MTKKFISVVIVLVVLVLSVGSVFATSREGYFTSTIVKEIDKPEVAEVVTWSAVVTKVQHAEVIINELSYKIKYWNGKAEGTLEKTEGKQIVKVEYKDMFGKSREIEFVFNVVKTIVVAHEDATYKFVKYVNTFIYTSGEFKGEKVQFYPETKIKWDDRNKYYTEHFPFLTKSPTPSVENSPSPSIENSTSPSVEPSAVASSTKTLPKTGETSSSLIIFGVCIVCIGITILVVKKLKFN